jgi:hypothetical protein
MSPSALWLLGFLVGMFLVVTVIVLPRSSATIASAIRNNAH